ncbi:HPP family protein [bacterium]|nr:HPP family protein [bacterium]
MRIFDKKFRKNMTGYILQCLIATGTVLVVLLFLNVLTHTALIAALGASTFIVFAMPKSYSARPRSLVGGYSFGIIVGVIYHFLSVTEFALTAFRNPQTPLIFFGAAAVGTAIFLMSITSTEHAPAAGISLGLVLNPWDYKTIIFILCAVLLLSSVQHFLKPHMLDLREL